MKSIILGVLLTLTACGAIEDAEYIIENRELPVVHVKETLDETLQYELKRVYCIKSILNTCQQARSFKECKAEVEGKLKEGLCLKF